MRIVLRYAVLIACCATFEAHAQIYTCTAPDGTRIFSDEKCGPDAKIVPGISTKSRASAKRPTNKAQRVMRSPAELEQLLSACNAGDMKACTEWTHGGGPQYLREQERQATLACERGSLEDCERRYCMDGMTEECRRRVLEAAKIAGDTWYVRSQRPRAQGGVSYEVRCAVAGARDLRDAIVECAGLAGPDRCELIATRQRFARFDQAAASFCASGT
ncbi:MAG: DUF4124 domain-containing protein [Gammaproteobacteria bacterium]|nr:hypothetical protein [Gammaproteobacteria bacterium]